VLIRDHPTDSHSHTANDNGMTTVILLMTTVILPMTTA